MTKTEKLIKSINKIITANLQPFGTRMGKPSYVYTGKGDEATQILAVCQDAGMAFVVKDAELPELPTMMFSEDYTPQNWYKEAQKTMSIAGWKKTEEIK